MNSSWLSQVYAHYPRWKGWGREGVYFSKNSAALFAIELKRAAVQPPAALLEIGYGSGQFIEFANSRGFRCVGLEISDAQIDRLRALGIDARQGKVEDLGGELFDLVVAFDVFEHMSCEEILCNLKQIASRMRVGSRLIARFPNAVSPFGSINQFGDITHITALSGDSFAQLAMVAGFKKVLIANAAWVWRGSGFFSTLMKPTSIIIRRLLEVFLGFVYFGRIVPLDPSVSVVLEYCGNSDLS